MWKLLLPLVVLALAVGAMSMSDRGKPRADFTFVNKGDVTTLDVQRASWSQDLRVIRSVHEGLVKNDIFSREFDILPGAAERWEVSADGRTYTFHLRENAKWSNGERVKASDFVFSWRRALLPDTVSDYSGLFQLIEGGKEFYSWREAALKRFRAGEHDAATLWAWTEGKFHELVRLRAVDERTLRVRLTHPTSYWLNLCAFAVFYPVYPELVSRYETPSLETGRVEMRSGWTKPGVHVSNGPFVVAEWRFKRDMRLERNPHYWDQASVAVESVNMPSIEDPNAVVLAYRTGSIDFTTDVDVTYRADMLEQKWAFYREHQAAVDAMRAEGLDPIEIARRLPPDPRNEIHPLPAFGTYFYNFNCMAKLRDGRDNPFFDARVRRAFALAVDKERIVREVKRSGEPVAETLVPRGSLKGYSSPKGLGYDPAAARRLLAEAGFPGGQGFITVEILFNKDAGHDKIAQAIKKDWEENLGVNVSLQQREIKVFRNDLKNQNFMVSRASWFGDYGDPTTFLDLSRKDDGNNDRKYANAEFEAIMDAAAAERDEAKRMTLLSEAEQIIVERDLPLIPIFQYVEVYLFDPHTVTGVSSHPRQEQNIYQFDVLGDGKGLDKAKFVPSASRSGLPQRPDAQSQIDDSGVR
jgi:oligopeptide transport system substrate-binding protein